MKAVLLSLMLAGTAMSSNAQMIQSQENGSGSPGNLSFESMVKVDNDIFHAPQYLPGYPTAATLWPRVIDVPCVQVDHGVTCKGYVWNPSMGRGEYLFVRPHIEVVPEPVKAEVIREVVEPPKQSVPVKKVAKRKKFVKPKTCTVK